MLFFKVFLYELTWGMNSRSTDCEADALTTRPFAILSVCVYVCVHARTRSVCFSSGETTQRANISFGTIDRHLG